MATAPETVTTTGPPLAGSKPTSQSSIAAIIPKPEPIFRCLPNISVRQYHPSHAASLARNANNPKIWANLRDLMPHPYTVADADWWIEHCSKETNWMRIPTFQKGEGDTMLEMQGSPVPGNYAIVVSKGVVGENGQEEEEEVIGSIGLVPGADVYRRTAELGYWLAEEYWGKGVMSSVARAFVAWAWKTFPGLVRINACTYGTNEGSRRVLQRAGFKIEGTKPLAVFKLGKVLDEIQLGAYREGIQYSEEYKATALC